MSKTEKHDQLQFDMNSKIRYNLTKLRNKQTNNSKQTLPHHVWGAGMPPEFNLDFVRLEWQTFLVKSILQTCLCSLSLL